MLEFLTENLKKALKNLNINNLYEIRIRAGQPIRVNFAGVYRYLSENGLSFEREFAIIATQKQIEEIVYSASNYSVYSVEEQIKKGFITAERGERIGLAGEYVFSKGQAITIRDIRSICIRVPHEVIGCGEEIYKRCLRDDLQNLLIASPPGLGKTTILRDLARILSEKTQKNILICDERGEIAVGDIGLTCDIVSFSDKKTAFEAGIRAMRPDIMITDEIAETDISAIKNAISGGVTVIASAHLHSYASALEAKIDFFDEYAFLNEKSIGLLKCVYGKHGEVLYENDG